jgi:DNA invertase Pin-like site-specific DNA recombinase
LRDLGLSAYRGTHRKEGALAGFLAAVRAGAVPRGTVLIVEGWDRLSREQPERALNQFTGIILAGVKVATLRDEQEHDEASVNAQPHRLFHSLALMISAHAESEWNRRTCRAGVG